MPRQAQGSLDILGLGAFVAAGQKNDHLEASLLEIDPLAGTVVDSHL